MTTAARDIILPAEWRDFWALTKPRVMSLVVFTALCGLLAAPGSINPVIGFTAILCLALGAGACGALNQYFEADIDAKMARTAGRPLPAGRMDRASALNFGIGLAAFSVGIMGVGVLIFFVNVIWSLVAGRRAEPNYWGEGATTLEWTLTSPPPYHQFETLPVIK